MGGSSLQMYVASVLWRATIHVRVLYNGIVFLGYFLYGTCYHSILFDSYK